MILIDLVAALLHVIDLLLDVDSLPPAPLAAGEEVAFISFERWLAGANGGVECDSEPPRCCVLNSSRPNWSSSSRMLGFESGGGDVLQPVLICTIEPLEMFETFVSLLSVT